MTKHESRFHKIAFLVRKNFWNHILFSSFYILLIIFNYLSDISLIAIILNQNNNYFFLILGCFKYMDFFVLGFRF